MNLSLEFVLAAHLLFQAGGPPAPVVVAPAATPATPVEGEAKDSPRTELNLAGKTDTASGESRRNENVQFNLIDNGAQKELNIRVGSSATLLSEFRPDRGYFGAEYGVSPSSLIHLAGKARTGFHGTLRAAHQNSIFSARAFFQVGSVKPARDNDYGFTVSFPEWRKLRLNIDAGQQKIRGVVNGNVLVPQPDERTPLATDPATRAIVAKFLAAYPAELPNRTDINSRALNRNAPQSIDNDNARVRLDFAASQRDLIAMQYQLVFQNITAFQLVAGQTPNTDTKSHKARVTWSRQWNAGTVSDFSFGADRVRNLLTPENNAVGPLVIPAGLTMLGPEGTIPIDRATNLFRTSGALRRTSNRHGLTAGFEVLRRQLNGSETDSHRGFFSFNNDFGRDAITNLRLGLPTQHIISIGDIHRGYRNWDLLFFAGDTWKVTPELTVQIGLRYQPVTTPREVNQKNTIPYPCDCNNFAPSLGIARRLGLWGTLRANYGLHYGEIFPVTFQQVRFTPPLSIKFAVPAPPLVNPLSGSQPGNPNFYVLDSNLRLPYVHHANLMWEAALSRYWKVQAGYVGSRQHKLLVMWYLNRAHPRAGIPLTTVTINQRRAKPDEAETRYVLNGSRGYFDAGRLNLQLARWRGIAFEASYWFSKSMDLGASYTNTAYDVDSRQSRSQSEFETQRDGKSLSAFDQPHAFLWRGSYETRASGRLRALSGWTLASVILVKPGTPFNVQTGSDGPNFGNVDGNGGDRPNLLDASILGRTVGHPDTSRALLPRAAFAFIRLGEETGNLGRNTFRKGPIRNVNSSLSRAWTLRKDYRVTFSAESINFFNTAQFAEPGFELTNANFGQITNTLNDGRTFRLSVQLGW